jgi:hypothetical protein
MNAILTGGDMEKAERMARRQSLNPDDLAPGKRGATE